MCTNGPEVALQTETFAEHQLLGIQKIKCTLLHENLSPSVLPVHLGNSIKCVHIYLYLGLKVGNCNELWRKTERERERFMLVCSDFTKTWPSLQRSHKP